MQVREILNSGYDSYAYTTDLKDCLDDFIRGYSIRKSLNVATIGFKIIIYCMTLCAIKYKIKNPEKYHIRKALKCFFLYSILNKGRVNQIYKGYPAKLTDFFNDFDELYTTNYDTNVETFLRKKVNYLHGSFLTWQV